MFTRSNHLVCLVQMFSTIYKTGEMDQRSAAPAHWMISDEDTTRGCYGAND